MSFSGLFCLVLKGTLQVAVEGGLLLSQRRKMQVLSVRCRRVALPVLHHVALEGGLDQGPALSRLGLGHGLADIGEQAGVEEGGGGGGGPWLGAVDRVALKIGAHQWVDAGAAHQLDLQRDQLLPERLIADPPEGCDPLFDPPPGLRQEHVLLVRFLGEDDGEGVDGLGKTLLLDVAVLQQQGLRGGRKKNANLTKKKSQPFFASLLPLALCSAAAFLPGIPK